MIGQAQPELTPSKRQKTDPEDIHNDRNKGNQTYVFVKDVRARIIVNAMISCHESIYKHYNDVIMSAIASQITTLKSVYSTVSSGADQSIIKGTRHWPL